MSAVLEIGGLISGFDYLTLIDAMIEIERAPIYEYQAQQAEYTTEMTAWQSLNTTLLALKIAGDNLMNLSDWNLLSSESSDTDILTVSADSTAPMGAYSFTVNQLATNHQISSNGFADTDTTTLGTGT